MGGNMLTKKEKTKIAIITLTLSIVFIILLWRFVPKSFFPFVLVVLLILVSIFEWIANKKK
jgi:hypothetical protein